MLQQDFVKLARPEAVLFDLDGTLLDTARDLGNALNAILAKNALPELKYEDYRDTASHGSIGLLKLGFGGQFNDFDEHQVQSLKQAFLDHYQANLNQATVLFEQIHDLIKGLDQHQIPWGIVTNKPGYLTDALIVDFPEFAACKVIISGDTLAQRKPHPAPLLHAAELMSVNPENCWYVGDAERDIAAGNAANMTTFTANWGYTRDELPIEQWRADWQLIEPNSLLKHLNISL
ncbi:HAD-IA family hydrolase [Catenovulum sp. SM1970]|uniref:HAD family hydrolase n=1 Tax=Marinifaba aquimaris TaxID=2741323 RepID=UPI001574CC22|nr:HAD-IA family hydrolase [Marinifaba aquimaris]NTS77939.1 HAD-IA family hydrolase [Marinifaba aquimaris]